MMRPVMALLVVAILSAATYSSAEQQTVEHVIIPAAQAASFVLGHSGTAMEPHWTPTPAQVAALEARLPAFLARSAPAGGRLRRGIAGYRAQYVGIVRGGRQVIFANFFCDSFGVDWRRQPVIVDDGGDCFFVVEYDPAAGTFAQLLINGEA